MMADPAAAGVAVSQAREHLEVVADDPDISESERTELLESARASILEARRFQASQTDLKLLLEEICRVSQRDTNSISAFSGLRYASVASPAEREIAPGVIEDVCLREMHVMVISAAPFLEEALGDSHNRVRMRAIRCFTSLFRRVLGFATATGVLTVEGEIVQNGAADDQVAEDRRVPHSFVRSWMRMFSKVLSLVADKHDGVCKAAIKFAESGVLALSYSGASTAGSQEHFTLDFARSQNGLAPCLSLADLERFGHASASTLIDFVCSPLRACKSSGSIRVNPYITALMVLGNLSRRRKLLVSNLLPPLLEAASALVSEQASPCIQALLMGQRLSAIMTLRLSLQAVRSYSHVRTGPVANEIACKHRALLAFESHAYGLSQSGKREDSKHRASEERTSSPPSGPQGKEKMDPNSQPQHVANLPLKRSMGSHPSTTPAGVSFASPLGLPSASIAGSAALLYGQLLPPQELINSIITQLQRGPRRLDEIMPRSSDFRPEKRPKSSRFGPDMLQSKPATEVAVKRAQTAMQSSRRPIQRRVIAPPVVAPTLSEKQRAHLLQFICRRIMQREEKAAQSGAGPLRVLVLGRILCLATRTSASNGLEFMNEAIEFIMENIWERFEIAMAWLHAEVTLSFLPGGASYRDFEAELLDSEAKELLERLIVMRASEKQHSADSERLIESSQLEGSMLQRDDHGVKEDDDVPVAGSKANMQKQGDAAVIDIAGGGDPNANSMACGNGPSGVRVAANGSGEIAMTIVGNSASDDCASQSDSIFELPPMHVDEHYEALLLKMLSVAAAKLGPDDRIFSRLIVEAPFVPEQALNRIVCDATDPARSRLGLSTLRDIVMERPGSDRDKCLSILLNLTNDPDEVNRGPAVRLVASKLYEDIQGPLHDTVEHFAIKTVGDAVNGIVITQAKRGNEGNTESLLPKVEQLKRSLWLLSALAAKNDALLRIFAASYLRLDEETTRAAIVASVHDIAGQLGPESVVLLQLVRGDQEPYAFGNDALGDLALAAVTAAFRSTTSLNAIDLVRAACIRYDSGEDSRLLRAVVAGMNRKELLRYLPVLVSHKDKDDASCEVTFKTIVREIMSVQPKPLPAAEFVVALHNVHPTPAVCTAVKVCIEMKAVFKEEDVSGALQKLVQEDTVPELLMRTVLLTCMYHPLLENFVRDTIMLPLVTKKIWKTKTVWLGFVQYCLARDRFAVGLLACLPLAVLKAVLSEHDKLRGEVEAILVTKGVRLKQSVRCHLQRALQRVETTKQ